MIGQYLAQTNESATVPEAKIFCKLNKAYSFHFHACQQSEQRGARVVTLRASGVT